MAGPSAHGQKNKPHKAGRQAGRSAREKHKITKEGGASSRATSLAVSGKLQRANATKQIRDRQRELLKNQKRRLRDNPAPPMVVALLPLSSDFDVPRFWNLLMEASQEGLPGAAPDAAKSGAGAPEAMDIVADAAGLLTPLLPVTVALKQGLRLTFLPPPADRADPLAIVELGRVAEVVMVLVAGGEHAQQMDSEGEAALGLLRSLGLPSMVAAVQGAAPNLSLQERSAIKKRARAVVSTQVGVDSKLFLVDSTSDAQQLLRHLAESTAVPPLWRSARPAVSVDAAEFRRSPASESATPSGTLVVTGYVRCRGLSANQLVHVPGAGDFQIERIEGRSPPPPAFGQRPRGSGGPGSAMDLEGSAGGLVALPVDGAQEVVQRENEVDGTAGEQTWPTEEELMQAGPVGRSRKRFPEGTSDYQAAWLDPDDSSSSEDEEEDLDADGMQTGEGKKGSEGAVESWEDEDGSDTDAMEDESVAGGLSAAEEKKRHRQQQDDVEYPDEIDTPDDIAARVRFAKFRGLKSWRTSVWDPKEGLPRESARIFAFVNSKRAQKRAKEAAALCGTETDPDFGSSAPEGSYVSVFITAVPEAAAERVVTRVQAAIRGEVAPLQVFGLLQHESKLSVLNFGVKKATAFEETLPSKAELLLVTGLRSFVARPIYSTDDAQADKHKMERFLHAGRPTVASVIAPISYGPLPLLAFQIQPDGQGPPRLAATGALRGCNPDRVVLKKVTLSGFPVKVHKKKAVVRWMFHNPDDIRWFRPLELWTKYGRRGRIKEPVGTHGSMKCIFDGVIQQRDAIMASLYKRVFPVWPADMAFA